MSSLSNRSKALMEIVFGMETGYVLGNAYSTQTFANYIMAISDIDILREPGYAELSSKAKKFRRFVDCEDDSIVSKAIIGILEKRDVIIERKLLEDETYVDSYKEMAEELRRSVLGMQGRISTIPVSNDARFKADVEMANNVLQELLQSINIMCNNSLYTRQSKENEINDAIRDLLIAKGYCEVKDQTRHGMSLSGKDAGEVDILLTKDEKEVALIEGMKLSSVDKKYLEEHINKATINYNQMGTPTFVIVYYTGSAFGDFWERLKIYLDSFDYQIDKKRELVEKTHPSASIRVADAVLSNNGYDFPIYYIVVAMK